MAFRETEFLEIKAETKRVIDILIAKKNEDRVLKLRLESLCKETENKEIEIQELKSEINRTQKAAKVAHENAMDSYFELCNAVIKRIGEASKEDVAEEKAVLSELWKSIRNNAPTWIKLSLGY